MIPDPVMIPLKERYGSCESLACFGRECVLAKKPVFVYDGLRLCRQCVDDRLRSAFGA